MGTRADFYIGRNKDNMQYLGSIAHDGYPEGNPKEIVKATTETKYVKLVIELLNNRDDASIPERDGWPWPWDNSRTTDYAYAFDDGKVWASRFGRTWFEAAKERTDEEIGGESNTKMDCFPDMTKWKKVTLGKRSGLFDSWA